MLNTCCLIVFFSLSRQLCIFCLPILFLLFSFTCLSQSTGYITSGYEPPSANDPNTNAMNPQMATIVAFQRCPLTLKPMYTVYKQNRRTKPHNNHKTFNILPAALTARNQENKCMHHVGRHIIWPAKAATTTRCNSHHYPIMMQRPRLKCGCSGHQQGDDAIVNTTVNISNGCYKSDGAMATSMMMQLSPPNSGAISTTKAMMQEPPAQ